jgi:hypothetical protein
MSPSRSYRATTDRSDVEDHRPRPHNGKARLEDRTANTAEQLPDLILRQRFRQPVLPGRANPFFPEQSPRTASVWW